MYRRHSSHRVPPPRACKNFYAIEIKVFIESKDRVPESKLYEVFPLREYLFTHRRGNRGTLTIFSQVRFKLLFFFVCPNDI